MPYRASVSCNKEDHLIIEETIDSSFASLIIVLLLIFLQVKKLSVARLILQVITRVNAECPAFFVHSHFVLGVVKHSVVVDAFLETEMDRVEYHHLKQ